MDLSRRILKETAALLKEPPEGIKATPHQDNVKYFDVTITGPKDSPYEYGIFQLELFLGDTYPMEPPKVRFLTKIYHPSNSVSLSF